MRTDSPRTAGTPPPPRLDFRAGGWVLALGMLLISGVMLWRVGEMLRSRGERAVGDGRDPSTYGFDLSNCRLPRDLLVGSGLPRDGIPVLDLPPIWPRTAVDSLAGAGRNKYLVTGDRVIGVVLNGQARAYPLLILNWHEVVNDTLGGVPIAVTYNPLCDAAVVYDRRIPPHPDRSGGRERKPEPAGEPALFGHSGLLYNSDPLLYDRKSGKSGESLWIQLTGDAVAGPEAGAGPETDRETAGNRAEATRLRALPCQLVRWIDWRERYPRTTALARDEAKKERYRSEPYISYYGNDLLRFPARPLPATDDWPLKTPCVIVERAGGMNGTPDPAVFPLPRIHAEANAEGIWRTVWEGEPITFTYRDHPPTVWVDHGAALTIRHAFRFAWFALADAGQ